MENNEIGIAIGINLGFLAPISQVQEAVLSALNEGLLTMLDDLGEDVHKIVRMESLSNHIARLTSEQSRALAVNPFYRFRDL